jgi:hypothetical protein
MIEYPFQSFGKEIQKSYNVFLYSICVDAGGLGGWDLAATIGAKRKSTNARPAFVGLGPIPIFYEERTTGENVWSAAGLQEV